jgi:hypothetical protein
MGCSCREVWWEFTEGKLAETDRLVVQSNERPFRKQAAAILASPSRWQCSSEVLFALCLVGAGLLVEAKKTSEEARRTWVGARHSWFFAPEWTFGP